MNASSTMSTTWKRLLRIGWPFWHTRKRIAWGHLIFVVMLLFANGKLSVFINETAGAFMTGVERRSLTQFDNYLVIYVVALAVAVPIQVTYAYLRTRLALKWRLWLSMVLFKRYHANRAYHHLLRNNGIDHPDQRMTQKVATYYT